MSDSDRASNGDNATRAASPLLRVIAWGCLTILVALVIVWRSAANIEPDDDQQRDAADGSLPVTAPVTASPLPPAPEPDVQLWQWSSAKTLSGDEVRELNALPVAAFMQWIGSIDLVAGAPRFAARGGAVRGLATVPRWSVIRIEVRCLPLLGTAQAVQLAALVASRVQPGCTGLQLDVDVPLRLLPAYGAFLTEVRQRLPDGTGLACTGLVSWLSSPDLASALRPVDWWVPQCYSTSVPKDPTTAVRLAGGGSLERVMARCEALHRPYRIGLPTFEQVTWWNPDRSVHNAAVSVALEDLLAAGLQPLSQPSPEERLLRFIIPTDTTVGTLRFPAGSILLTGQPTVAGLALRLRTIRSLAGPWFRGVALFRLAGTADLPALSTAQVLAALQAAAVPTASATPAGASSDIPALDLHWSGRSGAWELTISNRSTNDLLAFSAPCRVIIDGVCEAPLGVLAGGIRCVPALAGVPVGPAHSDGLLVTVPFLRAGFAVTLPPLAIVSPSAPDCRLVPPRTEADLSP